MMRVGLALFVLVAGCRASSAAADTGDSGANKDGVAPAQDSSTSGMGIPVVYVKAGRFTMGSPETEFGHMPYDQNPVEVTLTRSFWMAKHETTLAEWRALGFDDPKVTHGCSDPECPVSSVNGWEAVGFANALSRTSGQTECYKLSGCTGVMGAGMVCSDVQISPPTPYDCDGFRLPTEAEWEYAVRAGTSSPFYSGDIQRTPHDSDCVLQPNLDRIAWYCANSSGLLHPAEQKEPNALGLFDMAGNVDEWVSDRYDPNGYGKVPLADPWSLGPRQSVVRGGAATAWPTECRSASRLSVPDWSVAAGFRLVRTFIESP